MTQHNIDHLEKRHSLISGTCLKRNGLLQRFADDINDAATDAISSSIELKPAEIISKMDERGTEGGSNTGHVTRGRSQGAGASSQLAPSDGQSPY